MKIMLFPNVVRIDDIGTTLENINSKWTFLEVNIKIYNDLFLEIYL